MNISESTIEKLDKAYIYNFYDEYCNVVSKENATRLHIGFEANNEYANYIDKTIKASDLPETIEVPQKKMKPNNLSGTRRKKSGADDKMALYFPEPQPNNDIKILFQTVHSVKGETHDITIFVCPEPKLDKKCPSETWWSTQSEELEEKRIAYVAITRTQRDLILCVSRTTYNNLSLHKKDFVELFKEVSMEECRDYYSNTST